MAGGHNHAKQIVIEQATCLADKLQNGNSGCTETQGKAIGLLVKMVTPLYEAEFVTIQDCRKMHGPEKDDKDVKTTKIKIGSVSIEGPLTAAILVNAVPVLCIAAVVFMVGKVQSWW